MNSNKAYGRDLRDFLPLMDGEKKILNACKKGAEVVLNYAGVPTIANTNKVVRADFLRFLLLGGDSLNPVHERGVNLRGAYITGTLDLSGCKVTTKASLEFCRFHNRLLAKNAVFHDEISLQGSLLVKGFEGDLLHCEKNLILNNGFKSNEDFNIQGCRINGDLNCQDGAFIGKDEKPALSAKAIVVKGSVFLNYGFKAFGQVNLMDAKIGCNLVCSAGEFSNHSGNAICADRLIVNGSVFFDEKIKVLGELRLLGAYIGSNLTCESGYFENSNEISLDANRINVKGSVFLNGGLKANGVFSFINASVGGNFDCSSGSFEADVDNSLILSRSNIGGSVHLNNGFRSTGVVFMLGTTISGNFNCIKGDFYANKDFFINAQTLKVKGVWHFRDVVRPVKINAMYAHANVLDDAIAAWEQGSVLDGLTYNYINNGSKSLGEDRLIWLNKQYDSHRSADNFRPQPWHHLQSVLLKMGYTEDSKIIGIALERKLQDLGKKGSLQKPNKISDVRGCLESGMKLLVHRSFGIFAGYGYRPFRLVTWLLSVWLGLALFYWIMSSTWFNAFAPTDPLIFENSKYSDCRPIQLNIDHLVEKSDGKYSWVNCNIVPGEYSTFSPIVYSLDTLLPFVDLGQEKSWSAYIPSSTDLMVYKPFLNIRWGYLVRFVNWLEIMFGWVSSLLLVAIISGLSRRNEEK